MNRQIDTRRHNRVRSSDRVPAHIQRERVNLESSLRPSARQMFTLLLPLVEAARPVIGERRGAYRRDKSGRKRYLGSSTLIYGRSTFRNRIHEDGQIR